MKSSEIFRTVRLSLSILDIELILPGTTQHNRKQSQRNLLDENQYKRMSAEDETRSMWKLV